MSLDLSLRDIREDNRQDSELFNFAANLAREHAASITADPLKAAREDHRRLLAHYRIAMEQGNKLTAEARKLSEHARECFSEAQLVMDQLDFLERMNPGVFK